MSSDHTLPSELKALSPYLARAKELTSVEPVISYWCTYYALQQAIEIESKDADSNNYLLALMDKLEQMKEQLKDKDTVTDDAAASAYVENFAIKVFAQADNEDRAGKSNRMTAKKFLAAANFLEVLAVFGDMSSEISEKIKYSKWKASDISKALREGRKPTPGPAGGLPDADLTAESGAEVTKDEARELAKELAELGTEEERAKATLGDGAPAQNTRSAKQASDATSSESQSYPFPQVPTSAPLPSPGPIPEEYDNSLQSSVPVSFDSTHITQNVISPVVERDDVSTPVPPTTHQTAELEPPPPHEPDSSGFASAVFPSAPPSIPQPSAPPTAPSQPAPSLPRQAVPPPQPLASAARAAPVTPLPSAPAAAAALPDTLDPSVVSNIQKHAKWAISALNYDDYETARKELRLALSMLGG
ncbi:hypothetical protein ACM66B_002851 [Microbotryomycetes sp. NB124-2]